MVFPSKPMYREPVGQTGTIRILDLSGTVGQSKRLEAIQIKLTGDLEQKYDVYYRVHCQTFGWLDWAKNGEVAGTSGYAKRIESIQIQLVQKRGSGSWSNLPDQAEN